MEAAIEVDKNTAIAGGVGDINTVYTDKGVNGDLMNSWDDTAMQYMLNGIYNKVKIVF